VSRHFPTPEERGQHVIFPGVTIQTVGAEKMLMSLVELQPRSVVEEHSHPHEQIGMMLEGRAVFTIGDETKTLGPGDFYRIPGGVRHKVVTLDEPARALDIFSPCRDEYL
jgi:quercetin dioxygenase-like cupin family protein